MQVSNIFRTFVPARTRQASQRCSNVRVVLFLYISLAEILVFLNDSYFFVNIENMEENGNVLIIAIISVKKQRFPLILIIFYYLCPK